MTLALAWVSLTLALAAEPRAFAQKRQRLHPVDTRKAICIANAAAEALFDGKKMLRFKDPASIDRVTLATQIRDPDARLKHIEANSDQRQPYDVGASPYEMEVEGKTLKQPKLSERARVLGQRQATAIRRALGVDQAEFEAWPTYDDYGQVTWVFARWRAKAGEPWQWLDEKKFRPALRALKKAGQRLPVLPEHHNLGKPEGFDGVFADLMEGDDLYEKPSYGDCVFTSASGAVLGAWLPVDSRASVAKYLRRRPSLVKGMGCVSLPQPARFNREPVTFQIKASKDGVRLPPGIRWINTDYSLPEVEPVDPQIEKFPAGFRSEYKETVVEFAGEKSARFPKSHRRKKFVRKNSADPKNQLGAVVDWLGEKYETFGFEDTEKRAKERHEDAPELGERLMPGQLRLYHEHFSWRSIPQQNLLAVIPGASPENGFILVIDHIDTAFAERVFDEDGKRVSVPGADDNGSAVAAQVMVLKTLKDKRSRIGLIVAHITGEEWPADDLGIRELIAYLLRKKIVIRDVLVNDMSGFSPNKRGSFQINAVGDAPRSVKIAGIAENASHQVAGKKLNPIIRLPDDPRNNGYNTDAQTLMEHGFARGRKAGILLLNELVNARYRLLRPDYHGTGDTSKKMNFPYAEAIAKVEIETLLELSNRR